ncbi:hypothetical protein RvY_06684 [Ramazzottius varieornatus]|uniref:Arf-GAP domain-containing protein n=1 Tax=Ramazzottius varieornatus TaxID=947166 RepID=A0A1D1V839_RAMVA|nr:hypothetical protein RvY_06684 [Ramazzottius varieornatus]
MIDFIVVSIKETHSHIVSPDSLREFCDSNRQDFPLQATGLLWTDENRRSHRHGSSHNLDTFSRSICLRRRIPEQRVDHHLNLPLRLPPFVTDNMATKSQTKAEQNSKIIRQIGQLPHNKNCFDCGQKGPTYVNLTIGGYVCTACSGILRGLNPPHRVKSISMGTFQDDEVKFMQLRGNAFCKKAWLWNFDPQTGPRPPEIRDDQKMKDFLAVKYEKKKWYHPAHDTQMADQLKQQDDSSSYGSLRGTDSESSLSRRTSTNSQRSQKTPDSANAFNTESPVQRHAPISLPRSHTASSISSTSGMPSTEKSASDDLFSVFGALQVTSTASPTPAVLVSPGGPNLGVFSSSASGSQEWANFAKSQTVPAFTQSSQPQRSLPQPIPVKPLQPMNKNTNQHQNGAQSSASKPINVNQSSSSDKYAALAELDEMVKGTPPIHNNLDTAFHTSHPTRTNHNVHSASWNNSAFGSFGQTAFTAPVWPAATTSHGPAHNGHFTWTEQPAVNQAKPVNYDVWGSAPPLANPFLMGTPNSSMTNPQSLFNSSTPHQHPGGTSHPTNPFL